MHSGIMPHHEIGNAPGYNIEVEHTGFHGVLEAVLQEVSNLLQTPVRLSRTSGKDSAGNFQKRAFETQRKRGAGMHLWRYGDTGTLGMGKRALPRGRIRNLFSTMAETMQESRTGKG